MNTIRYCVGFAAGILDGFSMIRVRDYVFRLVRYDASTLNGFDRAADLFTIGR